MYGMATLWKPYRKWLILSFHYDIKVIDKIQNPDDYCLPYLDCLILILIKNKLLGNTFPVLIWLRALTTPFVVT